MLSAENKFWKRKEKGEKKGVEIVFFFLICTSTEKRINLSILCTHLYVCSRYLYSKLIARAIQKLFALVFATTKKKKDDHFIISNVTFFVFFFFVTLAKTLFRRNEE